MHLILYSKPGCHLCEGLQEKLVQIVEKPSFACLVLEVRDITTRDDWFAAYEYEIPVLFLNREERVRRSRCRRLEREEGREEGRREGREGGEVMIPRPSPRVSVAQLEQLLQKYM